MTRSEALAHAATIVAATDLPVSADLENAFADEPAGVAETDRAGDRDRAGGLLGRGLQRRGRSIYEPGLAAERVAAAVEVAHRGPVHLVVTARAENHIHGRPDLGDTIARLKAYDEAGADVLYAPGLVDTEHIRAAVEAVGRPVNVLARRGAPSVAELGALGVKRISVGGAFAFDARGGAGGGGGGAGAAGDLRVHRAGGSRCPRRPLRVRVLARRLGRKTFPSPGDTQRNLRGPSR